MTTTTTTATTPTTTTTIADLTTVDDAELLTILGLTSTSPLCDMAVLDWDDMPELSEEDEDDDKESISTCHKRKQDDIFAEFDFVEVVPENKKQRKQPSFVSSEDDGDSLLNLDTIDSHLDDEDIRLALELISS